MAFLAKVGAFNSGTGAVSSTVAITGVGFQPKAIFFWWSGRTDSTDAVGAATIVHGYGFAVSTSNRCAVVGYDELGAASSVAKAYQTTAACIATRPAASPPDGLLDLQSMDSDGFTLVVDDVMPFDLRIHYLALGGSDLTNAIVLPFTSPTVTGNQAYTGAGFQADCGLIVSMLTTGTADGGDVGDTIAFGVMVSPTEQATTVTGARDGRVNMETSSYSIEGPECIAGVLKSNVDSVQPRGALVSWDSDGFTINWLEVVASSRGFFALLLKGGQYAVGSVLTQTDTTTDIVVSGLGFQPVAALFSSACRAESTQDTPTDHAESSVGAFTSTSERGVHACRSEDTTANAETTTAVEHDAVYANISSADVIEGLMDVKSVDIGGFTLIMDDADPAQSFVWYLAFGSNPSGDANGILIGGDLFGGRNLLGGETRRMTATHLGFYNTATTRTRVRFSFSTHAAAGGNVAPNSAFEAADLRIYRAADGAAFSNVERSSANGVTMTSPFDTITGFHAVDIDLTDDTDAGFYASGYLYMVVLAPDETVDSQTITGIVLAYFEIGLPAVNTTHAAGTAWNSGAIGASTLANDTLTAAKVAADVTTEFQNGLATAAALSTVEGKVDTIDLNVDQLLIDVAAVEAQTDDIGVAGAGLTAVPWNAAWDAEVQSEVQDAIEANHLDHLLAADYDPASKPGVATALLNELVESDGGVSRFTANSLEQAPTGGGAGAPETWRLHFDRKYGSVDPIPFVLTKNGLPVTGVTLDAGDFKIIKDQGADNNVAGSFVEDTLGAYHYVPAAGELACKNAQLIFNDAENICDPIHITIHTYGDPNAQHTQETIDPADLAQAADLAVVDGIVDLIKVKTDALPTDPADESSIQAAIATLQAFVDTEVAAIKAKTDNLPSDPADQSILAAAIAAVNTLATAIKAKTDSLTFSQAGQADVNLRRVNNVTVVGTGTDLDPWRAA